MQTFLPYRSFRRTAACLDRQRLGKQRLEVLQILSTLNGESVGWRNHPAVLMWDGYTEALVEYGYEICTQWRLRGYVDNLRDRIVSYSWGDEVVLPPWLTPRFIRHHRSNLLRKDPEWYGQFNWNVPGNLPYIWPTKERSNVN